MIDTPSIGLRLVGPEALDDRFRGCLRPGMEVTDRQGFARRLPTHFYEVPSWDAALDTKLAAHFGLWELIDVDVREAEPMRTFPRYVPYAITTLAAHLQILRWEVGRVVRIAANGGFRSPGHELSAVPSPHVWGTAANIYRIGDEWLDSRESIERYREIARRVLPGAWTRPFGSEPGYAFDHLHIDIGYLVGEAVPTDPVQDRSSDETAVSERPG